MPRFDQSFTGLCEQNLQDTLQLKQRYLDTKSKRVPKSKDKKQQESIQSSVHVQQKFLKRSSEELDPGGSTENFEPPVKLQCTTQQHGTTHQNEGLTKFSVEIVQQLEFTTSAANSQPQQISTNVTVKAHTNASVKSDVSSPKSSNPSTPASTVPPSSNLQQQKSNIGLDVGTLVECVKQEPDNDFADLDQCAAALEKDAAANGGTGFGGFADLIGEDANDEIITSDAFNDLISDISNYPELMKDFDFDQDKSELNTNGLKVEDIKDIQTTQQNLNDNNHHHHQQQQQQHQHHHPHPHHHPKTTQSPLMTNPNNYSPPVFDNQNNLNKNRIGPYSNMDFCKTELSPAAQTLKQMAEQHQHKNQISMSFNPNTTATTTTRTPNTAAARSPYPDFQFQNDYGSPSSNTNYHKNSPNFTQSTNAADMIKQEMIYQSGGGGGGANSGSASGGGGAANDFDMKRKTGIYKQQYSPYSSPSSHGSPGYLPRSNPNTNNGPNGGATAAGGPFGGGTPPRPPSGPGGGNNTGATLQINQAQQLHINQQNHAIQVSAGQHVHLSGDFKGNVSIAAQQGMHFTQHSSTNTPVSQQNTPTSNHQQQQQQQQPQHQQNSQIHTNNNSNNNNNNGNNQQQPQQQASTQQQSQQQQQPQQQQAPQQNPNITAQMPPNSMMNNQQQMPNNPMQNTGTLPTNLQQGPPNGSHGNGGNAGIQNGLMGGPGNGIQQHNMGGQMMETYSMSQTQTINFTQQTLRQRANGPNVMPNTMGATVPMGGPGVMANQTNMGPRLMTPQQQLEQQKLLQQQQILRAQQAAALQQHMVRPPPPDYKTTAGMMQNMPPRYASLPPNIRRMPQQPMPPSGPMIRSHNMYMMPQQQQQQQQQPPPPQQQQQQQMIPRNMYPRQPNPLCNSMEAMQQQQQQQQQQQHGNTEWRHLIMAQQQSASFTTQMRPNLQQGFNINPNNMQLLQHQQIRNQQGLISNQMNQNQMMGQSGNPMAQMNNMNQQMLTHMQQQQTMLQQQQNSQMCMTNLHMQQTQSLTISNQNLQQQQQQQNQLMNNSIPAPTNQLNSFNSHNNDFSLEFLDNLPTTDSTFTDQELLNSFDSDSGFNLDF